MKRPYNEFRHKTRFVPRLPELLKLEGPYGDMILSCRHADILRCADTRHFISCFKPSGMHYAQPLIYCTKPEVCIIFKRDKSGAFRSRVFGFYVAGHWTNGHKPKLNLAKVYGNGMDLDEIKNALLLKHNLEVDPTYGDNYYPVLGNY